MNTTNDIFKFIKEYVDIKIQKLLEDGSINETILNIYSDYINVNSTDSTNEVNIADMFSSNDNEIPDVYVNTQDDESNDQSQTNESDTENTSSGSQLSQCDIVFKDINITSRIPSIDGFEIIYVPEEPIVKNEPYSYNVTATLTHIETGCTKTFMFKETTYPEDAEVDMYGRQIVHIAYIEPQTCVDNELIEYAQNNTIVFVKPIDGDDIDSQVVNLYREVLDRTIIDSEGFNYAANLIKEKGYDEACKQIALDAQSYKLVLPKASYNARCYLGSIGYGNYDTEGREPIKICDLLQNELGYIDEQCVNKIIKENEIFVNRLGDNIDNAIWTAYKNALGRNYVDNTGAKYWRNKIMTGYIDVEDIEQSIASNAISIANDRTCIYASLKALKYMRNTDPYGREYYDIIDVLDAYNNDEFSQVDKECFDYVINEGDIIKEWFVKPNPNYEEDKEIVSAYKSVLGRNYIDSKGFNYWFSEYRTKDWEFYDLEKAIANSAINFTSDKCKTARENAINWNIAYGDVSPYSADPFGDGSCVAFYPLDGNANDYTGNGHNGEWVGTEQYDTGAIKQAAKFDGSSYIKLPSPSSLGISRYNFCFALCFKGTGNIGLGNVWSDSGSFLYITDSKLEIKCENYVRFTYPFENQQDKFYFVVWQNNGIYLNGKQITSNLHKPFCSESNQIEIGGVQECYLYKQYGGYFNGLIDNVYIFNRALTDEEIKILSSIEIGASK